MASAPTLPQDPFQAFVITPLPPQSQVPHVDDVLHRLEGVPEANFSSMVQEVSVSLLPGLSPTWQRTHSAEPQFPPFGCLPS